MRSNRWIWVALGLLVASRSLRAAESRPARPEDGPLRGRVKPPIRGLVSMGAYRFVGKGGEPVNTLEHVRKKAGISRRSSRSATTPGRSSARSR